MRSVTTSDAVPQVKVLLRQTSQAVAVTANMAFVVKGDDNQDITYVSEGQKIELKCAQDKIEIYDAQGKSLGKTITATCSAKSDEIRFLTGGNSYRGRLVATANNGEMMLLNVLDMESYLMGVVRNEIGKLPMEQIEAAKAQAVAARTYAVKNRNKYKTYDYVSDVGDQVYQGASSETDVSNQAVVETAGQILQYNDQPISAFFFSTCGGVTANAIDVWKNSSSTPYLQSIRTSYNGKNFCMESPLYRWEVKWTGDEIENLIKANLPAILKDQLPSEDFSKLQTQQLYNLAVIQRDSSQRIQTITIGFSKDQYTVTGEQIRRILKGEKSILYSSLFRIDIQRNADGTIMTVSAKGAGNGHGVGMCQWCARTMAKDGYGYQQILGYFYRGTALKKMY
ncbi:SpoIID/LytB domain-containing protein [bacterium]|nr:SpoIID/LytB domain-containing protein [bacterium]